MEPSHSRAHLSLAKDAPASANLTPSNLPSNVRLAADDRGHSLAEMARRDLDAALQLLADRAQYITGASGAAIALRRNGKKDMLCRASAGSKAPQLGALLSSEFGLSGESVRTRQPLRCDDAERDVRVNREVCRQLGIASVVVMPVLNDGEVLGVFELFSGKVNAFAERDLSAVQRLSEMVETAVRLADAAQNLPERLRKTDISAPIGVEQDEVLSGEVLEDVVLEDPTPALISEELISEELVLEEAAVREPEPVLEVKAKENAADGLAGLRPPASESPDGQRSAISIKTESGGIGVPEGEAREAIADSTVVIPPIAPAKAVSPEKAAAVPEASLPVAEALPAPLVQTAPAKKPLFWSAAVNSANDAAGPEEADQSHVPAVLRSLHKCEACGFPVSAGRALCVECEEKKWRGQLKVPQAGASVEIGAPAVDTPAVASAVGSRAFAASAQSGASSAPAQPSKLGPTTSTVGPSPPDRRTESKPTPPVPSAAPADIKSADKAGEPSARISAQVAEIASPDFAFSAGLGSSRSWLSANKYVIGVLLVVAAVVISVLFFARLLP